MRAAAGNEIEYLNAQNPNMNSDQVEEMSRRLDALRCFDQDIRESDWHPHTQCLSWRPDSKRPA